MGGTWVRDFCDELDNFPLCADKDQVDSFVHGLSLFARPGMFDLPEHTETYVYDETGRDAQKMREDLAFMRAIGVDDEEVAFDLVQGPENF
jgi:hypothetical protein